MALLHKLFLLSVCCFPLSALAAGSWNGIAFSHWNGIAVSSWNGTSVSAGPAVLLQDSFTRANNASSLGSATIGGAWSVSGGTWGIVDNQAYNPGTPSTVAFLNASDADVTAQVKIVIGVSFTSLVFRYSDINNYWHFIRITGAGYYLQKIEGGGASNLFGPVGSEAHGDVLKVVLNGSSIKCYVNDVQVGGDQTSSFNASATRYGFDCDHASTTLDDFIVWAQ
jgi:hypothetical protein